MSEGRSAAMPAATIIALGLFTISTRLFFLLSNRKKRMNGTVAEDEDDFIHRQTDNLSRRGILSLKKATPSYWFDFLLCLQNPCDPVTNPDGYIALCLAENKLIQETLALRLIENPGTTINAFSDSAVYNYNGFLGLVQARVAVAFFLERWMLQPKLSETDHETRLISCDNIVLASGVGSLVSNLMYLISDTGGVILIPAPYYTGYEHHAKAIAGCTPWPVYMKNPLLGPDTDDLEKAAIAAEKDGREVRALLLTNPNDPLGVIYNPEVILQAVTWARTRRMHILVDEIYALSTHHTDSQFVSVIKILSNVLSDDVHMLWGLSKDFGASGFRFAVLYTQNKRLLAALANLNIFSCVSQPMQMIVADILMDHDFVASFLAHSSRLLQTSYKICTRKLDEMVIPYTIATAGLFVYVDFSSLLSEQTEKGEREFAKLVQESARLVMTPGSSLCDNRPGRFRICYASVPVDVLEIAMQRLSDLVLVIRRNRI